VNRTSRTDDGNNGISGIYKAYNREHLSFGIIDYDNRPGAALLNGLRVGNSIPASRFGLHEALELRDLN
jgi:hypothetical protein